jgi:hypothetical protein
LLLIALPFESSPSMREPGPPPGPIAIVVFFALLCHGAVLVSSLVVCKLNSRALSTAILGAFLATCYGAYVYSAQQAAIANYVKSLEDIEKESNAAFTTVESISWCAIRYALLHGGNEYPPSLAAITDSSTCLNKWSLNAVPHYTVIYALTARGFSVKATAPRNPLSDPRNAESNESGITLIEYQDPRYRAYPVEMGTSGSPLSDISTIQGWLRNYSMDHKEAGYPRQLTDVSLVVGLFNQHGLSQFLSPNSIQYGKTLFTYEPAGDDSGKINSYELHVTCKDYGGKCLHSFLLTSDGRIFFTPADRPATVADTKLERCPPRNATTFCTPGD